MATLLLNIPALSMVCAWERHLAQSRGWAGRQDFPFQQQCKLKFAPAGLETTLPLESTLGVAPAYMGSNRIPLPLPAELIVHSRALLQFFT